MLSPKDIKEFQDLWLKEFGESIDEAHAAQEARQLLTLAKILIDPLPRETKERQPLVSRENDLPQSMPAQRRRPVDSICRREDIANN